jgi:D-glycero-alpha-D-manno-heptose-7-phosphate kinase
VPFRGAVYGNIMRFLARAPVRVDPAGGGTDAPPYCIDYGGAVVNFSVARHSYASFESLPRGSGVLLYSHDQKKGVRAGSVSDLKYDGRVDLLKAFARRLLGEEDGCLLVTQSDVPQGTGLGGSGALGVAILGAIARAQGKQMTKSEIALLANDIERKDLGNSGGNQDSFGGAIGGIKLITYAKGGGSSCETITVPDDTRLQLERDSLLIYTGEVHLSGTIHVDIRRSYEQPDSPTVRAMDNLKAAALKMADALKAGCLDAYIEALNCARLNHYALHSSCDSDSLRRFFRELSPYIRGGKACGAGGGGFIMVHAKPERRKDCIQIGEALGGMVWPMQLDHLGLVTWQEAPSSAEQLEAICRRV